MRYLEKYISEQTEDVFNWTGKLILDVPQEKWYDTPEIVLTNLAWQIGHITLSQYFYTVFLIQGPDIQLAETISMKRYSSLFFKGDKINTIKEAITVDELLFNWRLLQNKTMEIITALKQNDLNKPVFTLPKPHPFVKIIEDSISWHTKHTMWHNGQIGLLKRLIRQPYNFGM